MNDDFKKLYEVQEKLSKQLKNVVDLQTKEIGSLHDENKLLKQENQELKKQNQVLTEICEEQQGWVKKFLGIE